MNKIWLMVLVVLVTLVLGCKPVDEPEFDSSNPCEQKSKELKGPPAGTLCTLDATYGYEYNSTSESCVEVFIGSSSCPSSKTPFKYLEECQSACLPSEFHCENLKPTTILSHEYNDEYYSDCIADTAGEGYVYDSDIRGCHKVNLSPDVCHELESLGLHIFESLKDCKLALSCQHYRGYSHYQPQVAKRFA